MRIVFALAILLSFFSGFTQSDLHFNNEFTIKEGLSNNNVNCMMQDSRGFLWIGTIEGLNRFDGYQFKKIFSEKNNNSGLSHNNIFDIIEYQYGQLLIATSNGLCVYNTITNQFENEKIQFPIFKTGAGTVITNLYKDPSGNIWVNENGELDILDSNLTYKYRFTDLPWAKPLKGILIRFEKCYTDQKNQLWLPADQSSLAIINFNKKEIRYANNNPENASYLKKTYIRSFLMDEKANTLWYAPWGLGLIKYDFNTKTEQQVLFGMNEVSENRTINSILKTATGKIVCAGSENIYEVDPLTLEYKKAFSKTEINEKTTNQIYNNTLINSSATDYWAGTTQGLIYFSSEMPKWTELTLSTKENQSLTECTDLILCKNGKLIASYYNNELVVIEKNRKETSTYKIPNVDEIHQTELCEDFDGNIWVGTNKGIFQFDPVKKRFLRPTLMPKELSDSIINVLFLDEENNIWIGTRTPFSLYKFNKNRSSFEKINSPVLTDFANFSKQNRISQITGDSKHNIWLISQLGGGILNYNLKTGIWKNITLNSKHSKLLVENGLVNIIPDSSNNLWMIESLGNGLIQYNYSSDKLTFFRRTDGLQSDYIHNICTDISGNLWIITEYGITRFNPNTYTATNTTLATVNYTLYPYQECIYDPYSSTIVYGLNNRLLFFNASRPVEILKPLIPIIDEILVNNQARFTDPLSNSLILNPDEKNIAIDFTTVNLNTSGKVKFAYQLEGADADWKTTDNIRTASYSSLSPGKYTFKLKAAYENEKWSSLITAFSFTIAPPVWQTWWFITLFILALSLAVYVFFRYRIKSVRKEADLKHTIAETEMMALRAQMNPHFIFNCLNSIDNLIQTEQKEKATDYLAKFAQLIRAILENSKNNTIPCWKDLEALQLYIEMEQLRWDNKIQCQITIDPDIQQGDFKVPPMVVQPYIENAIHHGLLNKISPDKKLTIDVNFTGNDIKYTITDNGVGREKAAAYKKINRPTQESFGMQITNDRINLFNGKKDHSVKITDLYNKEHLPEGTLVEVWLTTQPISS